MGQRDAVLARRKRSAKRAGRVALDDQQLRPVRSATAGSGRRGPGRHGASGPAGRGSRAKSLESRRGDDRPVPGPGCWPVTNRRGGSPRSARAWAIGLSLMASGRVPTTSAIRYWRSFPPGFGAPFVAEGGAQLASESVIWIRKGLDKRRLAVDKPQQVRGEFELAKKTIDRRHPGGAGDRPAHRLRPRQSA